jgi:hypothetical protein
VSQKITINESYTLYFEAENLRVPKSHLVLPFHRKVSSKETFAQSNHSMKHSSGK